MFFVKKEWEKLIHLFVIKNAKVTASKSPQYVISLTYRETKK